MSMSLTEIAGGNFRTDEPHDEINTKFMKRLGMRKRYLPARLAISRSLAIPTRPESLDGQSVPSGRTIKGDTLFGTGTDLYTWVALIVEHADKAEDIDLRSFIELAGDHWRRGLDLLDEDWESSDRDVAKFIKRLVTVAALPTERAKQPDRAKRDSGETFSSVRIDIPIGEIGEELSTEEKIFWSLNGQGGSPHSAIMGGVGSGKTRTAVAMLRSIREQAKVPLLAFDFKGDLGTDETGDGYHIDKLFGAQVLEPPKTPVPLDVLSIDSREESDINGAAYRFRESFSRLKGSRLGARQRTAVLDAATQALKTKNPCLLDHIREDLVAYYEEHEIKEDGAISTMKEICHLPLFKPTHSPADFFQRSWIIKLPRNVPDDSRTIVVNLVLDALDQYLNSLPDTKSGPDGARSLRILCMVDEAHQILKTKLPSLSNLIRMSRSKGGAIMLISQSPDDFSGEDDEFLSEMGLVAAFATNAKPGQVRRILGKGADLSKLQNGQCYAKRRGDQTAKKIKAW